MRNALAGTVVAVSLALAVGGCSHDTSAPGDAADTASTGTSSAPSSGAPDSPSATASAAPTEIDITVSDDTVTPRGERVEASVGDPVRLVVQADEAGEIHVHSSPEQELSYGTGRTVLTVTIDKPGVVDVESHDLGVVIVQLQVS